jgi:hypothetical protein
MDSERTKRRHVRDKSVIDHLADSYSKRPQRPDTEPQNATTDTGLSVEKQVRKKWDPKKGGLPTFYPPVRD